MPNIIDRLYDEILPRLDTSILPNWPSTIDLPLDPDDTDIIWRDLDTLNDDLTSLDEYENLNKTFDRMANDRIYEKLNNDEEEIIAGGIRHRGMEVLAFYKSRRFKDRSPFKGHWGIFYLRQGLSFIQNEILKFYPGYGNPRLLAVDFLRAHEKFHFYADLQTLFFESIKGKALYEPVRRSLRQRASHFVEEALANRQVWDWSKKREINLEEFAYNFMKLQPNSYARFDENRIELAAEWASVIVDLKPPGTEVRDDLAHWVESIPKAFTRPSLCPEYVISPAILTDWINPALRLPPVKLIKDASKVIDLLSGRLINYKIIWENTKDKLLKDPLASGLNFKPWPKDCKECCSVKVDKNYRAHLRHLGGGSWEAYKIGSHKEMGHG